jgi:predicted transposase/invertase (TIGR01784 family)
VIVNCNETLNILRGEEIIRLNQIENDGNMMETGGKSRLAEIIDSLTLFDDDLMTLVFDGNIEATELLLTIILGDEVKVISVRAQVELRSPYKKGRKIRVDILAQDEDGKRFNVEVQGDDLGADCRRARYHSSMVDVNMLKKGKKYEELCDSYVIFITKNDYFEEGKPIYWVERTFRETGKKFNDGSHIIYVNGSYKGNDAIGKLVHDFRCSNADDMYYSQLADGVRYYKEVERGEEKMNELLRKYAEDMAEERVAEETKASKTAMVRSLMKNMHLTIEQAFDVLEVSEEDRKLIAEKI